MSGSDVAKRYAKAFLDIAREEGKLGGYYDELTAFAALVLSSKDLQDCFANPVFDEESKLSVVQELAQRLSLSPTTANFLSLLVQKRRIDAVVAVQKSYEEMMDKALAKARVSVKTAFKLSDATLLRLQQGLEELTKKKVEMSVAEDPSLIGGVVVRIGDILYDGSIKTQLSNISNLLGEER